MGSGTNNRWGKEETRCWRSLGYSELHHITGQEKLDLLCKSELFEIRTIFKTLCNMTLSDIQKNIFHLLGIMYIFYNQ